MKNMNNFQNSKSSAYECWLVFASFFANFSLALLIKKACIALNKTLWKSNHW